MAMKFKCRYESSYADMFRRFDYTDIASIRQERSPDDQQEEVRKLWYIYVI